MHELWIPLPIPYSESCTKSPHTVDRDHLTSPSNSHGLVHREYYRALGNGDALVINSDHNGFGCTRKP